uniref:Uncharacterized protein n=1 Tax=Arundo donax TaxID=35708 RepID=A0A0A9CH83_ARUDO
MHFCFFSEFLHDSIGFLRFHVSELYEHIVIIK